MKFLIAFAFTVATTSANASAVDVCQKFLNKYVFWGLNRTALVNAARSGEALNLFRSLSPVQIATLNQEIAHTPEAWPSPEQINRELPVGSGIYYFKKVFFLYDRGAIKARRLNTKFARFAISAMGGDVRAADYVAAFEKDNRTRDLFFSGPLNSWSLSGRSLKGEVPIARGILFFTLQFKARSESTDFRLIPTKQKIPPLQSAFTQPACTTVPCSEQMKRLLNPVEAKAMVPSGPETLAFIEELRRLGFAFTGHL